MDNVKITERGWPGHFICSYRCLFRRNTLIEFEDKKIVVSTVGNMSDLSDNYHGLETIGVGRYFETMAFHAEHEGGFWDADVTKQVSFDSEWAIAEPWKEGEANKMHEAVVLEITDKLLNSQIK